MQVPTIPLLSRLSKTHKYSAASMAAAGVGVLAITGAAGNGGATTQAAAATTDTAAVQRVTAWTPNTTVQQKSLSAQADAAKKKAERDAARKRAAAKAAATRKAGEAAAKRKKAREAASRKARSASLSGSPRQIARHIVGDGAQFQCFSNIVFHESSWNPRATNASSGAYGLVQALPGSKMASAGADWRTNPATQIKWGLDYMNSRYGSPCAAWSFWQAHNWY